MKSLRAGACAHGTASSSIRRSSPRTARIGGHGVRGRSTFSQNRAVSGETATCPFGSRFCYAPYGGPGSKAGGGAIWSDKAVSATQSSFSENLARHGLSGRLADWPDGLARGGAIGSESAITIVGGEYSSNTVQSGFGGAISGGAVSLSSTRLTLNAATGRGGALVATSLGAESVVASANEAGGLGGGAFAIYGAATVERSVIRDNVVYSDQTRALQEAGGAGISVGGHLQIRRSFVSGNSGDGSRSVVVGTSIFTFPVLFVGGGIRAGSLFGEAITVTENCLPAMHTSHRRTN